MLVLYDGYDGRMMVTNDSNDDCNDGQELSILNKQEVGNYNWSTMCCLLRLMTVRQLLSDHVGFQYNKFYRGRTKHREIKCSTCYGKRLGDEQLCDVGDREIDINKLPSLWPYVA